MLHSYCLMFLLFTVATWICLNPTLAVRENKTILSRPKRYLVFPEGSTFSWAFCMTIKAITPDVDIFSEAVAVAVSYDLPTNSTQLGLDPGITQAMLFRRERNAIYSRMESLLDRIGVPGNPCILRTICEAAQEIVPGDGLLSEIIRVLFLYPEEEPDVKNEPKEQWRYLGARKAGLLNYNCPDLYPDCPLSLLTLVRTLRPD